MVASDTRDGCWAKLERQHKRGEAMKGMKE